VKVKFLHPSLRTRVERMFNLHQNSTINELLAEIRRLYGLPDKRYDAHNKRWVNTFFGYMLIKNNKLIGYFDENEVRLSDNEEMILKDGDDISIIPVESGG